jgi:uncharacterized membrane protein YfcA
MACELRVFAHPASMVLIVALSLLSGLLIGCIGIGGVLLVPCLSLGGLDVHEAIAASMLSFIFSGAIGVWLYARHGSIDWRSLAFLAAGAAPGAFIGSLLAAHTSQNILLTLVGATVAFAGWRSMRARPAHAVHAAKVLQPLSLMGIAVGVGIGSAMTGTGGPVLLVPLLMWRNMPVLASVGLSQAIQIPIALMATVGNVWTGSLDLRLGALLSIGVTVGAAVGAHVAHAVPAVFLARVVAVALVAVGAVILVRSGHSLATTW